MFKLLCSNRIRLAIGLVLVCVLPAIVLPHWPWLPSAYTERQWVSVGVVTFSFVGTALNLRSLNFFPGRRSAVAGVPLLMVWYGVCALLLLLLRWPYSLQYIFMGFVLSVLWLLLHSIMLWRQRVARLAFVPLGRAMHLDAIPGAIWIKLEQPQLTAELDAHAIVADLHAPALTDAWQKFLAECTLQHIPVYNIRQVEESLTGRIRIRHMYENDLGSLLPSPAYMLTKRCLETLLIVLLLPILLPLMLLVALLIKLDDGGRVFYNQERVGYRGKPFVMYKFRSMTDCAELNQQQETVDGDIRLTRVGRFIRKRRIDELPQIFNVLKGEMSLIGPRAEYKKFADELEKQVPFYQYRHIVKPGISGWAQVMQGHVIGAAQTQIKIEYDFYYIKYFSFWLDTLIACKTIKIVLTGFGAR